MSLVGGNKNGVRRPSPTRSSGASNAEKTFQQKLEEIKRQRSVNSAPEEVPRVPPVHGVVPKSVKTVNGVKTFLKTFGDWVEVVSKSGKVYYYNKRTLVNQWRKPDDWLSEEERLSAPPPLPPDDPAPPAPAAPSQPPPPPEDDTAKLKLKLMTMKKIQKRLKNPDANLPLAYQKNTKRLVDSDEEEDESNKKQKLTVENAFEDPDEDCKEDTKLVKLDPEDEIGHLKPEPIVEDEPKIKRATDAAEASAIDNPSVPVTKKDPQDCRKFDPRMSGPGRAENLIEGCAAQLAFKNISNIPDIVTDPSMDIKNNPTFFTEYNLPCCLRRCKFPKEQDVLHELKLNKLKKRTFIPPPVMEGLDNKLEHLAKEAQMEQFMEEVKNYNNHDRLMTSRMDNVLVYKIPDEVWER